MSEVFGSSATVAMTGCSGGLRIAVCWWLCCSTGACMMGGISSAVDTHLVRGRICWLVQVDAAIGDVVLEGPPQRGVASRDGRVVPCADVELVIVLQQQGPLGCVQYQG